MLRAAMFCGLWAVGCDVGLKRTYEVNRTNQREEGTVFYLTYGFLRILADKFAKSQLSTVGTLPKYK